MFYESVVITCEFWKLGKCMISYDIDCFIKVQWSDVSVGSYGSVGSHLEEEQEITSYGLPTFSSYMKVFSSQYTWLQYGKIEQSEFMYYYSMDRIKGKKFKFQPQLTF